MDEAGRIQCGGMDIERMIIRKVFVILQRRTIVFGKTKNYKKMKTLQKHLQEQAEVYLCNHEVDVLIGQSFSFKVFHEWLFVRVHDRFQVAKSRSVKKDVAKFFDMNKGSVKNKIGAIRKKS